MERQPKNFKTQMRKLFDNIAKALFEKADAKNADEIKLELIKRKEAIIRWTYSCKEYHEVIYCRELVERDIMNRFNKVMHPLYIKTVVAEINKAIDFQIKKVATNPEVRQRSFS